jgi:hypothetical protein
MTPSPSRRRVLVLAVALGLTLPVLAGVALAVPAPALDGDAQLRVVELSNTSNYLQPATDGESRSAVARQQVDVGIAVASGAQTLAGRHDRMTFGQRFANAANESARDAVMRAAVDRLEARTSQLRATRTATMTAFRDGSLSASAYFDRLARLDAAIDTTSVYRETLESRIVARNPQDQVALQAVRRLEADLDTMRGPVTNQVRWRYSGNASAGATLVTVTEDNGFVHSTVTDNLVIREAQETGEWTQNGGGGSGDLTSVLNRVQELYPWTFDNQFGSRSDFFDTSLYKVAVAHEHGDLTVYLDGSTDEVFREIQANRLSAVPRDWTRSASIDGVELVVNGTYATGPMDVTVRDPTANRPIASDIRVGGTYVGSTDAEGGLWTVQPDGSFTVNATTAGNQTVELTVPATPA